MYSVFNQLFTAPCKRILKGRDEVNLVGIFVTSQLSGFQNLMSTFWIVLLKVNFAIDGTFKRVVKTDCSAKD